MIPILLKELRDRRWSLLAYSGIAVWLVIMYTSMFPSIQQQDQSFNELFKSLPEGYQKAFGITRQSFGSLEGFLGIELFSLTLPLILMLLAISRAGNAVAGEVERGTMRTLLSLPISRPAVYTAKYVASGMAVVVVPVALGSAMTSAAAVAGLSLHAGRVAEAVGLSVMFGLAVLGVAFLASSVFSDRGKVYMTVGGFMLAQYIAHVVAGLQDQFSWLDKLSAFHYFSGTDVMAGTPASLSSWLVFGSVAIAGAVLGLAIFSRRDISAR